MKAPRKGWEPQGGCRENPGVEDTGNGALRYVDLHVETGIIRHRVHAYATDRAYQNGTWYYPGYELSGLPGADEGYKTFGAALRAREHLLLNEQPLREEQERRHREERRRREEEHRATLCNQCQRPWTHEVGYDHETQGPVARPSSEWRPVPLRRVGLLCEEHATQWLAGAEREREDAARWAAIWAEEEASSRAEHAQKCVEWNGWAGDAEPAPITQWPHPDYVSRKQIHLLASQRRLRDDAILARLGPPLRGPQDGGGFLIKCWPRAVVERALTEVQP